MTAADLNAEFNNILNNALTLISPLTAALDFDGQTLTLDADGDTTLRSSADDVEILRMQGVDLFLFDGDATTVADGFEFQCQAAGTNVILRPYSTSSTNMGFDLRSGGTGDIRLMAGTTVNMTIVDTGEITQPLQPSFMATVAAERSNVTGNGTVYTIVWGTEVYDQGADWDNTSTFTAPVTGRYLFEVSIDVYGITTAITRLLAAIVASNRTVYVADIEDAGGLTIERIQMAGSVVVDMDAADTVTVTIAGDSGTAILDIGTISHISGSLIN